MLNKYFLLLTLFLFTSHSVATENEANNYKAPEAFLLPYDEFIKMKPHQQVSYIHELQLVFSNLSKQNDLFSLRNNSEILLLLEEFFGVYANAKETSDQIADEVPNPDEWERKRLQDFAINITNTSIDMHQNKLDYEDFAKILRRWELEAREFKHPIDSYETYQGIVTKLSIIEEEINSKIKNGDADFIRYPHIIENLKQRFLDLGIQKLRQSSHTKIRDELKNGNYSCIYAGFVLPFKKGKKVCRPINSSKIFGNIKLRCEKPGTILCNPLIYGFRYKEKEATNFVKCEKNHSPFKKIPSQNDIFEGICIDIGEQYASKVCGELADKNGGACMATHYITYNLGVGENNVNFRWSGKNEWNSLNTKLIKLCSPKMNPDSDLAKTCTTLADQIGKINIGVDGTFDKFNSYHNNSSSK